MSDTDPDRPGPNPVPGPEPAFPARHRRAPSRPVINPPTEVPPIGAPGAGCASSRIRMQWEARPTGWAVKRIDDEDLRDGIGSRLEADEADLLEQADVAVSDDVLDEEMDEREEDDE